MVEVCAGSGEKKMWGNGMKVPNMNDSFEFLIPTPIRQLGFSIHVAVHVYFQTSQIFVIDLQ